MNKYHSSVQSQYVSFELQSLGWKAFQDLCSTIISDILGQTVQIFLPSRDGGRDGAFHGSWNQSTVGGINGSFTVQCKFTSKKGKSLSLSYLDDEINKAERLSSRGLADNYILMTNYHVSGVSDEKIRHAFLNIKNIKQVFIFGAEWITLKILESSRLRMLVPRVYGLGDLSQILDGRAYTQAEIILRSMNEDLVKFVVTNPHRNSANAIIDHGFVLLLGEPASGKSTIAASLALGAIDLWNCSTLIIRDADEFIEHWNPHEPRQFFWVDDAFGSTQYQRETSSAWNKVFPAMHTAIKKGARILFTSRDYIYRAARMDLKIHAFPLLNESQVVINVHELKKQEKEQILYNHIKLGNQNIEFRKNIKPYLPDIANNQHFLPEVARRFGNNLFTKKLILSKNKIMEFVEKPLQFLLDIVRTLDRDSKACLAMIFMAGGSIESPIKLSKFADVVELIGGTSAGVREAFTNLNGSLVKLSYNGGSSRWVFKHLTIGDAIAHIVEHDPELFDIYIAGTPIDKIIQEVTCGNVGLEGVKVIIPISHYNIILNRLKEIRLSYKNLRIFYNFLTYRCDQLFLKLYIEANPSIFERISSPRSYLLAVPEVSLLVRLHKLNLLPEEWRIRFIESVKELAIETPDVDFLSIFRISNIIKDDEIDQILERVRDELIPNLSSCIDNWEDNYDRSDDPGEYFQPLKEALETYKGEFYLDKEADEFINMALKDIDRLIERIMESQDIEPEEDYDEYRQLPSKANIGSEDRNIFDDIDR